MTKQINTVRNCAFYVNDFLIFYRSKHIHTIEWHLQLCLNKINKRATENGFEFSKEKTKSMHFYQL